MADKQATVYVIDLGASTAECHAGRVESDLKYGMRYIYDKIGTIMATGKVSLSVGIVGCRTDDTDNPLEEQGEEYQNITVLKPLGPMNLSQLSEIRQKIVPNETENGDVVSGVVLAIDMIDKFTMLKSGKPGKFIRKIVLLTDGQGEIDDDIESIADKINESYIELIVIGIDFDDNDFGFKEEDKSSTKKHNEALLKRLTEGCKRGLFATAAEAIEGISVPDLKTVRPYKTYEERLALGDPTKYPKTTMYIDVVRYFKTKPATAVSASNFVTRASIANGNSSVQSSNTLPGDTEMIDGPPMGGDLSAVRSARTYKINDAAAPGGKRDVEREELEKGYEYGRTAVPISASEENVTKLETKTSFSIIGFVPNDKYERYFNMGPSCITIAQPANDKARMALSSFIHALYELDSYAVARIILKDGKDPQLILLAPSIEPDLEALVDVPLPFAEDIRVYRFPPLDRVVTTSGATLAKHRNLPTDDLVDAMSEYVDSMDLSKFGKDDEGDSAEYMPIEDTYSPMIHRINQAIKQRAVHPDEAVGPAAELLVRWSNPPAQLVSESVLHKLITAASVKKVPPKAKGTRSRRETIKPLSGLDVDSLLSREKRQKISEKNAIPEFKQMLKDSSDDNVIIDASNQMSNIIRSLVKNSGTGAVTHSRAMENMKAFRDEMIALEMPEIYNDFFRDFKNKVMKGQLGGDEREFWRGLRGPKLGLIDKNACDYSEVTETEANEFYTLKVDLPGRNKDYTMVSGVSA